jgi:hypothetical protein
LLPLSAPENFLQAHSAGYILRILSLVPAKQVIFHWQREILGPMLSRTANIVHLTKSPISRDFG